MTPLKLYLIRAVYDWSVDGGFTPQVLVDATAVGVKVPPAYVQDGRIVLNIHPRAVGHFEFTEDSLRFSARFGGQSLSVEAPYAAVLAIYARENNQGITFPEIPAEESRSAATDEKPPEDKPPGKGPSLRIVK
ncbi:MAG: ClpXP protease specificity-enhancing factor [Gammaproteobacteria bacterium]|nr:ClpXP protease specificity-enhancing factor [Gammaproteobacteria bacterium]